MSYMRKVLVLLITLSILLASIRVGRQWLPTFQESISPVIALSSTPEPKPTQTRASVPIAYATPTIALFFQPKSNANRIPVLPTAFSNDRPTRSTQRGSLTVRSTGTQPSMAPSAYQELVLYDDQLDPNWNFGKSNGIRFAADDTTLQQQPIDAPGALTSGARAIAVTPQQDYGMFVVSVQPESTTPYLRRNVAAISFWLNSGDSAIAPEDLAVALAGSNDLPYWTETAQPSALNDPMEFSETRLYYLDINRTIPPHTWVNVVVWLDKLRYDPVYKYVTGFYIKNDVDIRNTYYIDQISLLMIDPE